MYEQHWNLSQRPFENRIDSEFYYPAETHQAAVLKVRYAIENRRSAALLCGPSGMGKTMIVDAIDRQLGNDISPLCHIVFPHMNSEQLVRYVVEYVDPSTDEPVRETSNDLLRFEHFLMENLENDRHAVVVVDEAQLLEPNNLLEPLRLMLNIGANQAPGESAWTLVLVGQPMLLSQVERFPALDERMSVKCMLNRLLPEETIAYIQHRLRQAGVDTESVFEYPALERIHALSEGIPRRINRLCDLALMVGYAEDRSIITDEVVESVYSDLAAPKAVV